MDDDIRRLGAPNKELTNEFCCGEWRINETYGSCQISKSPFVKKKNS